MCNLPFRTNQTSDGNASSKSFDDDEDMIRGNSAFSKVTDTNDIICGLVTVALIRIHET